MSDNMKTIRDTYDSIMIMLDKLLQQNPNDDNVAILVKAIKGLFLYEQINLENTTEILNRVKDIQES